MKLSELFIKAIDRQGLGINYYCPFCNELTEHPGFGVFTHKCPKCGKECHVDELKWVRSVEDFLNNFRVYVKEER